MKYQIENLDSGIILGVYEGASARGALDALARDAGYRDYVHMSDEVPARPGSISVKEVG